MKSIFLVLCLVGSHPIAAQEGAVPEAQFYEANAHYQEGRFNQAIQLYQGLLEEGFRSGQIHYNLGNSFFREGALGEAIFHFRQASVLLPRDSEAHYNLSFARSKTSDKIVPKESLLAKAINATRAPLTPKELWLLLAVFGGVLFVLSCARLRFSQEGLRWGQWGGLFMISLTLWQLTLGIGSSGRYGVVTSEKAKIYSAVGTNNVVLFELHEGTELDILQSTGNWHQIQLADQRKGWLPKSRVITHTPA